MEYNWTLFNNSNGSNYAVDGNCVSNHAWDFSTRPNFPYPLHHNSFSYPPPPAAAFHALNQDKSSGAATHSSSSSTTSSSLHNFIPDPHLTCLKLGKRHYFEDATPPVVVPKKGKCEGEGGIPRCQVEGCEAALLKAKEYHRRHKVCEMHAKAPRVVVHGIQQRFCQQCSRFHGVAEFDDAKRSCRRRLAGHNERRRKSCHEQNSQLARKHQSQGMKMVGVRRDEVLNKSKSESEEEYCALSLLSSTSHFNNNNATPPWNHSDLPARCSAALRELIAHNRASLSASPRPALLEPTGGHLTLGLLQAQAQAQAQYPFSLLSLHHHKSSDSDHGDHDSSQLWNLPLGY